MRARTWDFTFITPCSCGGGKAECGVLGVLDVGDGDIEIGMSTKKRRYRGHSDDTHIFLKKEDLGVLIEKLTKIHKGKNRK